MNELVERGQCPFCLSDSHWRVVEQHWEGKGANTVITEKIHCMNKVEFDNDPGQFKECGCEKTLEYKSDSEYDPVHESQFWEGRR